MPRDEAMLRGGRERLRPILMTAITTLIGLVPIVVQKPSLGGVYYYSMALVIMGGLLVSTFLTSVLLPTRRPSSRTEPTGWVARCSDWACSCAFGASTRSSRIEPAAEPPPVHARCRMIRSLRHRAILLYSGPPVG